MVVVVLPLLEEEKEVLMVVVVMEEGAEDGRDFCRPASPPSKRSATMCA